MRQTTTPIVIRAHTPTTQELEQERLSRCRPADRSVNAVRNALDAIQGERAIAVSRLENAKAEANRLLLQGQVPQIKMAREVVEAAEIQVEQFAAMEGAMRVSLQRAEENEAAELAALEASIAGAEATLTEWRTFIAKDYTKAAAVIAKGLDQEQAAIRAYATLRTAAHKLPGRAMPADMPAIPGGGTFSAVVALPGHRMPPPPASAFGPYAR